MESSNLSALPVILGAVVILFVYLARFNTWAPDERKPRSGSPPRHCTTWGFYTRYAHFYTAIFEGIDILVLLLPETAIKVLDVLMQGGDMSSSGAPGQITPGLGEVPRSGIEGGGKGATGAPCHYSFGYGAG